MAQQFQSLGTARIARLFAICFVLAGCGGSDDVTADANPKGIWYGQKQSHTSGRVETIRAMVLADGTLHALADVEELWDGIVTVDGSGSASLTDGEAALMTASFPATLSNRAALVWLGATVATDRTMHGSYSSGGDDGEFTLHAQDQLFKGPSSLADLAGAYHYTPLGSSGFFASDFRIGADGTLTGTEARGTFTGKVQQIEAGLNTYKVSLSYFDFRFPGNESRSEYVTYFSPDAPRQLLLFNTAGGSLLPLAFTSP